MTVMVPLGNLAFALPFMPQNSVITPFDISGLVVIMVGLIGYRKGPEFFKSVEKQDPTMSIDKKEYDQRASPLLMDEDVN
jgi:hypothetical protein